jgi:hypothetical protein
MSSQEYKRLDALIVDIEDSTTLLKLYVGRLMRAPDRVSYFTPLVEHSREVASAVNSLDPGHSGREYLIRLGRILVGLAKEFNEASSATQHRILVFQEAIDLLESQLDHMLQMNEGAARDVVANLDRLEAEAGLAEERVDVEPLGPVQVVRGHSGPLKLEQIFEEDPFDDFALSDEFLDELVSGFDAALESTVATGVGGDSPVLHRSSFDAGTVEPGPVRLTDSEERALHELFAQIAAGYVSPMLEFIAKLRVGPVSATFIDLCLPAVQSIYRASASMGYERLSEALHDFERLVVAARESGRIVNGDDRTAILGSYKRLAELLPGTFPEVEPAAEVESESIILNSLLKQIKGVGRVTISRLLSAGLVTLDAYCVAKPDDLAAAAGLRPSLAQRICDQFRAYREAEGHDGGQSLGRLSGLINDLREAQFEFKKATLEEWYTHQPSVAKARARRARQQTMWKINVALAELGELAMVNVLKDDVYDRRVERLAAFLQARTGRTSGGLA